MWLTIGSCIRSTGIPVNFGITVALGFIVGTAIDGQTFYLFTLENLKQFGALKAMGVTNKRILTNATKFFASGDMRVQVLHGVDVEVAPGEITLLVQGRRRSDAIREAHELLAAVGLGGKADARPPSSPPASRWTCSWSSTT